MATTAPQAIAKSILAGQRRVATRNVIIKTTDVFHNLAYEDYLYNRMQKVHTGIIATMHPYLHLITSCAASRHHPDVVVVAQRTDRRGRR